MRHQVTVTLENKQDLPELINTLGDFDFNKIRPLPTTMISDVLEDKYAQYGRVLWIDRLLGGCPVTKNVYQSDDFLLNMVVPNNSLNMGEIHKKYDNKVFFSRGIIRKLPLLGRDDALHKYGYSSEDISYLFKEDTEKPKCQSDALILGKYTLENIINHGSVTKSEWITKNWGTDNPEKVIVTTCESGIIYKFDTKNDGTIFPLLKYIVKLLETVKMEIEYVLGNCEAIWLKPASSNYFVEM